jgi:hypothetical protein
MMVHDAICRLMRMGQSCLIRTAFCVAVLGVSASGSAREQAATGDVHVEMSQGFARILLHMSEAVESEVSVAGGIVVVHFRRPVDIAIDKLTHAAPNYVGAARRDPDGRGFRIALNRRVTVNTMAAGERLYIDLLPDTWKGLAPGLPTKVIEEMSRRTREAERAMRAQQVAKRDDAPARIRVAVQPTFTRYVFELPDIIPVTTDRGADEVTLTFASPLKFDFADMKSTLPKAIKSVEAFDPLCPERQGRYPHLPRGPELRPRCRRLRRKGTGGPGTSRRCITLDTGACAGVRSTGRRGTAENCSSRRSAGCAEVDTAVRSARGRSSAGATA